mgnify:CR=1 FL=1
MAKGWNKTVTGIALIIINRCNSGEWKKILVSTQEKKNIVDVVRAWLNFLFPCLEQKITEKYWLVEVSTNRIAIENIYRIVLYICTYIMT